MRPVQIVTDSCADLTPELMERYGIDYARMSTVRDGAESPALLEWTAQDAKAFYDAMRAGNRILTAQVSVEEFDRVFGRHLDEGRDIIYIACSVKQSGSVNTGRVVAQKLLEQYPGAKISCVNSLNASMGEGMLAIEAAKMAARGDSFEEIDSGIRGMRNNVNEYVTVHSLDALRKAGRVKGSAAFFGNLMGIKPIIISDVDGDQTPIKKVKGRANSLRELADLLAGSIVRPEEQTVYVVHGDCAKEETDVMVEQIRAKIPCKEVYVSCLGPIIGASIGPDAIGVFGFGQTVTKKAGA